MRGRDVVTIENLASAFSVGSQLPTLDGLAPVVEVATATLSLPTGRIMVCDPVCNMPPEACLSATVPPGAYRFDLSVLKLPRWGDASAVGCLHVTSNPPARLAPAAPACFGVDVGTGSIVDEADAQALVEARIDDDEYYRLVVEKDKHHQAMREVEFPMLPSKKLLVFATGQGDGVYGIFYATDRNGQLSGIVLDLGVLVDKAPDSALTRKPWWRFW